MHDQTFTHKLTWSALINSSFSRSNHYPHKPSRHSLGVQCGKRGPRIKDLEDSFSRVHCGATLPLHPGGSHMASKAQQSTTFPLEDVEFQTCTRWTLHYFVAEPSSAPAFCTGVNFIQGKSAGQGPKWWGGSKLGLLCSSLARCRH